MYHRQIFKLLLSNKVLDEPHQRRLFKTTDLVELFNLNEPIDGESSESDRLFRESKLTPASSGFSLSKIDEMRKLASTLSKKISATVKSTHDRSKSADNRTCESTHDEQNNNSKHVQVLVAKDDLSDEANLSCDQISTQDCPSECNEDSNMNSDTGVGKNNVTDQDNTSKRDDYEQDIVPERSTNDNSVEQKSLSSISDKVVPSSVHKRKKHNKDSRSRRKNISAMFEGERVSCLIGRRLGHCEREESVSTTDDDYVLRKLFAKSSN